MMSDEAISFMSHEWPTDAFVKYYSYVDFYFFNGCLIVDCLRLYCLVVGSTDKHYLAEAEG